jgi:hypothetical protein
VKTPLRSLLWAVWVMCFALAGNALAQAQVSNATAEALMRKSGVWEVLASVPLQTQQGFMESFTQGSLKAGFKPSPAELARVSRALDAAFAVEQLRAVGLKTFAQGLDSQHLAALTTWFDSPLGREVTRLEELAARDPTGSKLLIPQGATALNAMPAARRALIEEITAVTRTPEVTVELIISTTLAVAPSAASAAPGLQGASPAELRAFMEARRPAMLLEFTALSNAVNAKAYANLSTAQLSQYLVFLKSPAGSHFNDVSVKAMDDALINAARELGQQLPGTKDASNI